MSAPPRFTTFLFDLDGTLIDSVELILNCYRHTARTHMGRVPPDSLWIAGLGTPLRSQLADLAEDPEEIEAMLVTYREYHRQHHDALLKQYPGARDAVLSLKQRGVKLGVVTSKMRWSTKRGIELCGLGGVFDVFVTAEDVDEHKPDPRPVLRALELLGSAPEETVFVGDSPHDIAAGRAAGVKTAAVLWGPFARSALEPHAPDYWLTVPSDIAELVSDSTALHR